MKPTDAELEILHHLWQHGPLTVRMVNDMLNEARKGGAKEAAGYTTTLKLMQIMLEKGLLSRTEEGRTHTYSAVVREEDAQSMLLQQFVNNTFRGNTARLVMQALGNQQASADELDEIKALIATLENKEGDDDK
ncbi:MAG: BlaI/MecI/CopY family transcriptional regulator [Saprospiraceae bacterium]|nr:BlaI/MecI/CopY family transcriptional regulator [Saprospiraceae bacterium]MCB9342847.1 BlaI/MecI/CopY family transcriptional regulator [Lewinellaceae bacterium]